MLYDSSLWCRGLVCIVWLWYFQIMLTYFCDYTISWPIVTLWNLESWSRERLLMKRQTDNHWLKRMVHCTMDYITSWHICTLWYLKSWHILLCNYIISWHMLTFRYLQSWNLVLCDYTISRHIVLWDISRAGTLFFMIISLSDTFVLLISPELAHCTLWLYR